MNKQTIITAMLALVAFFLASCSSDDDNEYELLVKKTTLANPRIQETSGTNSSISSYKINAREVPFVSSC